MVVIELVEVLARNEEKKLSRRRGAHKGHKGESKSSLRGREPKVRCDLGASVRGLLKLCKETIACEIC